MSSSSQAEKKFEAGYQQFYSIVERMATNFNEQDYYTSAREWRQIIADICSFEKEIKFYLEKVVQALEDQRNGG